MHARANTPPTWAFVLAFGSVYLIWGSTYLGIKYAVESIPPFLMLASRFGFAGLLMYGYLRLTGVAAPSRREWRSSFVVGGLMLAGGTGSLAWAEQFVPSGLAALLVSTAPLAMVLLDWIWKGNERPSLLTLVGILVGFAGVIVLVDPGGVLSNQELDYVAAAMIFFGAFSWAAGSLHSRGADLPSNPFLAAAMQMTAGGIVLSFIGLILGEPARFDWAAITLPSWIGWAYLFVIGSFVPFNAYIWLMRNTTPARVSTYAFVNPIVAVGLGWAIGGEIVGLNIVIAIVLLVGAVVIITQQGRLVSLRRRPSPPAVACEAANSVSGGRGSNNRHESTDPGVPTPRTTGSGNGTTGETRKRRPVSETV